MAWCGDVATVRVTYDGEANAAYVRLKPIISPGEAVRTYPCKLKSAGIIQDFDVNLDFNAEGHLIGIEVLNASVGLPPELLKQAEIIG